jgi:uncharacterized protein
MRFHAPSRFVLLALAALAHGCGLATAADTTPLHTLWSVSGKSNTVYLLGSVHFLKPSEKLPAVIDLAYRDAEALVMELDMDDLDPVATQSITLELGMLPAERTLEQEVGADTYGKVREQARTLGIDPRVLNRFRPWLAAMTLAQTQLIRMGLDPSSGVEQRLTALAVRDRKPIAGLETMRDQLGMLATLPAAQQREFLLYSVEETERATQEIDQLIAAWRAGDTSRLARLLEEGFERYPDLYRPLTVDRNRRWIPAIEALLDDADDYLVVVGTLHLVGNESVIDLLERRGYKPKQH